ncbi:MAG: PAS domain-containing protein [Actinobacteria bacterium]|nr:PAS domain-containing protein [Actinomycetota bacterium]
MRDIYRKRSRSGVALRGDEENIRELRSLLGRVKDASEQLRDLEEEFQVFKGAFFEGILILIDGKIRYANDAAAAMFGLDPREMAGLDGCDFIKRECRDGFVSRMLEGGEDHYEIEVSRSDGTTLPVSIRVKGVEYRGSPAKAVSLMDVTHFKETERRLIEEKSFTESLFENLPDVFYVADLSGRLIKWNKSMRDVSGCSDRELAAKNIMDFIAEEDIPRVMTSLSNALVSGLGEVVKVEVMTSEGTRIDYEFFGSVLTDRAGNPVGISGIGRDLSSREES